MVLFVKNKPMAPAASSPRGDAALVLDPRLVDLLRRSLPDVAGHTISAVMEEVPSYRGAFGGPMGATIEQAVQMALGGFLRLASRGVADPGTPQSPAIDGAYRLGQGEAREGRSVDALLSAYRVGARVAWRELSATAVAGNLPAETVASFAELVFAYIDELSAASVAGHNDQVAMAGRARDRLLDRLAQGLLSGEPTDELVELAAQAEWPLPQTLTAILLPEAQARAALAELPPATLRSSDGPGLDEEGMAVLLVPDLGIADRRRLLTALSGRSAVTGPTRPWHAAQASYLRAVRALPLRQGTLSMDTEQNLAALVLHADPEALTDLRARALAPLGRFRPATADKLTETLRAWLLHHGRREEIARALFVHPQTVRYRLGQLREAYGDRLDDPDTVLELTVALGSPAG